ncbi:hypothetical protein ACN08Y_02695 [Rothia sp. P5764]|uniref:hypothetical protein n=1 Tax=Rothia sp. P5764 TaxID=3402654 RepID=UPI003AC791F0
MPAFKKKAIGLFALTALTLTCLSGIAPAGAETTFEQNLDYIVTSVGAEANDQDIRAEMLEGLQEYAQEQGLTLEQAAQRVADESRSYSTNTFPQETASSSQAGQADLNSGGGSRKVAMGKARYVGDVFYSSNSTAGIQHGHNGIYIDLYNYAEAPGLGKKVAKVHAWEVASPAPAYKYYVGWNRKSPNKQKAADFARSKIGKAGYNYKFYDNKRVQAGSYNCSQLVWAAYKSTDPNVDLDSNGGPGVYPADIANSRWTTWYETRS